MKRILTVVFLLVFVCFVCPAQQKIVLKNADIVRMTKSGLSADVILALIKQTPCAFNTSPKDLADLRKAKVSDAVIQAMITAPSAAPEPSKPLVDPGNIIKEGVGWGAFTVGANMPDLVHALGLPDGTSQSPLPEWRKLGINCLLDNRGEAKELRFNKGFRGVTQAGIGWGMPEKTVRAAYGEPESTEKQGVGGKWVWTSRGILIWFSKGRVNQIVIFTPQ
jgi:hypothetical protein